VTLEDIEKLLLTAPLRIFRNSEYRGYFENELKELGITEKLFHKMNRSRDFRREFKRCHGEEMYFYYLR